MFYRALLIGLIATLPLSAYSGTLTFSKAKKELVKTYQKIPDAKTFYCGCDIHWQGKKGIPDSRSCGYTPRKPVTRSGKLNERAQRIEWEHVVPAHWFGHQRLCWQQGGRKACKKDPEFVRMEGDLHNLQPAIGELNGDRSNYRFAALEGEPTQYGACQFKVDFNGRKAEPRSEVRGDIARTYFYMADRYNLRISKSQQKLFYAWATQDPVDDWEIQRNRLIKQIQGNGNPWIE
jgi:deoxyribonuclease-1